MARKGPVISDSEEDEDITPVRSCSSSDLVFRSDPESPWGWDHGSGIYIDETNTSSISNAWRDKRVLLCRARFPSSRLFAFGITVAIAPKNPVANFNHDANPPKGNWTKGFLRSAYRDCDDLIGQLFQQATALCNSNPCSWPDFEKTSLAHGRL